MSGGACGGFHDVAHAIKKSYDGHRGVNIGVHEKTLCGTNIRWCLSCDHVRRNAVVRQKFGKGHL